MIVPRLGSALLVCVAFALACDSKPAPAPTSKPAGDGAAAPTPKGPGAPAPAAAPVAEADTALPDGPLPDRDPALAHRLVEQHGAILLDVRSAEEFGGEHLEGAHNVPHDQIDGKLSEIEALVGGDKGKPIVLYCVSGRRAGIAKEALVKAGYTRVTNLGGITDW